MYSSTKTMCQRVWGFLYKQNPLRLRVLHKNASTEWSECLKEGCSQLRHLLHETGNVDAKDRAKTKRATSNKHPDANTHHDLLGKLPFSTVSCIVSETWLGMRCVFPFLRLCVQATSGSSFSPFFGRSMTMRLKGVLVRFVKQLCLNMCTQPDRQRVTRLTKQGWIQFKSTWGFV